MSNCNIYENLLEKYYDKDKDKIRELFKNEIKSHLPYTKEGMLTKNELKRIDISQIKNDGVFTKFKSDIFGSKFYSISDNTGDLNIKTGESNFVTEITHSDVSNISKIVNVKLGEVKNLNDVTKMIHEITHAILETNANKHTSNEVYRYFNILNNALQDKNRQLEMYWNVKDPKGKIKRIELKSLGSTSALSKEEMVTTFLTTLITNDFIKSNKAKLAKLFADKENFKGLEYNLLKNFEIPELVIRNKDGVERKINSLKHFYNVLEENNIEASNIHINDLVKKTYAIINSSDKIKEMMFGSPKRKDDIHTKTINKIVDRINTFKQVTEAVHKNFFDDLKLAELLEVEPRSIALNRALALANGGYSYMNEEALQAEEHIITLLKDIDPNNWEQLDNVLGHMMVFGVHFLNSDIMNVNYRNGKDSLFFKLSNINTRKISKWFESYGSNQVKAKIKAELDDILNNIENRVSKQERIKIEKLINDSAYGNYESFIKIEKILHNISKANKENYTYKEIRTITRKLVSLKALENNIDNNHFKSTFKVFSDLLKSSNVNKINDIMNISSTRLNEYSIFGENVDMNFLKDSKNLYITDNVEGIPEHNIVYHTNVNGVDYYGVIGTRYNTKLGKQTSMMLNFDIEEFEKGLYERGYKGITFKINAQNMKLHSDFVDKRLSRQFSRNTYIAVKKEIAKDLGYRQWKILKDNGLIYTQQDINDITSRLGKEAKKRFTKLSKNNPLVKISGIDWYVDSKYLHQFEGTEGFDLKGAFKFMNQQNAERTAMFIKGILESIRELSKALLLINPKVHMTNFMGSLSIYAMHTKNNGMYFMNDFKEAKKLFKEYKEKLKKAYHKNIELQVLQKKLNNAIIVRNKTEQNKLRNLIKNTEKEYEDLLSNIKNHEMHSVFESGFTNTLRTASLQLGTVEDMMMYQWIKNTYGEDKSEFIKALFVNDNHPFGKKVGDLFEAEELYPKLALYLRRKKEAIEEGMTPKKAEQEALNVALQAFPQYNNMHTAFAVLDYFSPYTKFFLSAPRMAAFAASRSPVKFYTTALLTSSYGLPLMFNDNSSQDEWFAEHGYLDIATFGDEKMFLPTRFLDPIVHPFAMIGDKPFIWDILNWAGSTAGAASNIESMANFVSPIIFKHSD